MLKEISGSNKFGRKTIEISFSEVHPIRIHEINDGSFLVEFKEFLVLYWKTHFSFVSRQPIEGTVVEALDRVFQHFSTKKNQSWPIARKESFQKEILEEIKRARPFS